MTRSRSRTGGPDVPARHRPRQHLGAAGLLRVHPAGAKLNLHAAAGVGAAASFHEQLLGAHDRIVKARNPEALLDGCQKRLRVLDFFRGFPLVPFDAAALAKFGELRARKVRIGTMDLRIAATALSRDLTLVTRNHADFRQVPGLKLADWTK